MATAIKFGIVLVLLCFRHSRAEPSVADQLKGLMSDSRFNVCEGNPSDPTCMAVREESERKIVMQQNQIDLDLLNSRAYIDALKAELIAKVAELKKMNETLVGSMFAPGLVDQYKALALGLTQMDTMVTGADKMVNAEVEKRGQLYNDEMVRISSEQKRSAQSAQNAMLGLANANLMAQSAQIRAIGNNFGRSLGNLGDQTSNMLAANDKDLSDMRTSITTATNEAKDELAVITESASVAKEDARAVAAVGNATFKAAEKNLIATAQAQLPVYKKYADVLIAAAKKDMNSSLTDSIREISDKLVDLRSDLIAQFSDNSEAIFANITKLKDATAQIVPDAIARANGIVDRATVKVGQAQSSASTSTASIKTLTASTAQLLNDVMAQIKAVSVSAQDRETQAKLKVQQDIAGVKGAADSQLSQMSGGIADELSSLGKRVGEMGTASAQQVQTAKDQYIAQLADMQADSGSDSLATMNTIGDANQASSLLGKRNDAKLQLMQDTNAAKLASVSGVVQGALSDAADASNEIETEFGAKNRQLELSSGQMVAEAAAENSNKIQALGAGIDGTFRSLQSSAVDTQKLSQQQVADLRSALSALSSGSASLDSKTANLEQQVKEMTTGQLADFQSLLTQIDTSGSLIQSTDATAQAKLKQVVQDQLSARLNALQSTLSSGASDVRVRLTAASDDAKTTTANLVNGTNVLQGNYQKTMADMSNLLASLSGAKSGVASSASSMSALLSSMTNKEVVEFKLKIGALTQDSAASEDGLRAYLSALIANKTDSAKFDTQATFLTNQEALTAALDQATSELSQTKQLAANALLANQVVRANTSKLFDDFLATESRMNKVSNEHSQVLAEITANMTNWKANITQRIHEIQATVATGAAQLPSYAEDKLKNITVLISMSQDDLKKFLGDFQNSLDKAKAIQDHFQDSQSARIIAAMTGVSQAIVDASVRMASQVAMSDMSANDKAKALTAVLSELCGSIDKANADAGANDAEIAAKVRAMNSTVGASMEDISKKINGMMTSLATDKLNKDIGLAKNMESAVTGAGVGINASANALELAQNAIHRAVDKSAAGWATNNKDVYTLGGFLFSLSQESQQKLLFILQELQHGRMSMDQALALSRQVDISQIKSAQDVVAVLVGAMDGYDETVQSIFGNSYQRLELASQNLSSRVDDMVGDLVTLASVLDYNSSMLAHRVDKFSNISNEFIATTQRNVTDLQGFIFDEQAQVTRSMAALNSLMDYSEKDVQLRQQQFNNWIDALIANETQVISDKTNALKLALLGPVTTTPAPITAPEPDLAASTPASIAASTGSLVQLTDPEATARRNVGILHAEMKELDRRRNLRLHKSLAPE